MPRAPEASDHQKPGAGRTQKVEMRPARPLKKNTQPRNIVKTTLANGAIAIAKTRG